jgi:UDP-glucose 4-epimerase
VSETILLIGAAGFVGRHLTSAFLDAGHSVHAVTRRGTSAIDRRASQIASDTVGGEAGGWAPYLDASSVVIHLASASTPGSSAGSPRKEIDQNLLPFLLLLDALQSRPHIPLQYFSSAGSLYAPRDGKPSAESDTVSPRSYHGAAKVAAEHFISAWAAQFSTSATIIRPSNIYGPGQLPRSGFGVIPHALSRMTQGLAMDVWGDGNETRDYLFVGDLVDLCLAALVRPPSGKVRTINAAHGESTSLNTLFSLLEKIVELPLKRTYHPQRSVDADHVVVNTRYADELFGWRARTSLARGLAETWQWFRSTQVVGWGG